MSRVLESYPKLMIGIKSKQLLLITKTPLSNHLKPEDQNEFFSSVYIKDDFSVDIDFDKLMKKQIKATYVPKVEQMTSFSDSYDINDPMLISIIREEEGDLISE